MISSLTKFTQNDVEEYLELCVGAFKKIFTVEQLRDQSKQLAKDFMAGAEAVNKKLNSNVIFNHVYRIDGVMVKTSFSCQAHHYLNCLGKNQPNNPYHKELSKIFNMDQHPQGTAVVVVRQVTHKNYHNHGLTKYSSIQKCKYLVSQGYIYMFFWVCNRISLKIAVSLGCVVIKEMDIEINKIPLRYYFLKADMRTSLSMIPPKL